MAEMYIKFACTPNGQNVCTSTGHIKQNPDVIVGWLTGDGIKDVALVEKVVEAA